MERFYNLVDQIFEEGRKIHFKIYELNLYEVQDTKNVTSLWT